MKKTATFLAMALLLGSATAFAGKVVTEDFEKGYTDGEPLRANAAWFFDEAKETPTSEDDAGLGKSFGVSNGDREFTWIAQPLTFGDPKLVSITVGGDWQTDAEGKLDDDRAGWSISKEKDSSDNTFGVQMDPGGSGEGGMNIEAYWDGATFGDDGGRASIVDLPKLKADTWYRLRAKFTKLSATSVKIDVTFTELDADGKPTGDVISGSIADTSKLSDEAENKIPNPGYFTAETVWPLLKNFSNCEGGFDNAFLEVETTAETTDEAAPAKAAPVKAAPAKAAPVK